jgi:hypothetical protein
VGELLQHLPAIYVVDVGLEGAIRGQFEHRAANFAGHVELALGVVISDADAVPRAD